MVSTMLTREDLLELRRQLRATRDELEADIERRELEDGPVMREAPLLVHKVTDNKPSTETTVSASSPLENDVLIDAVVEALAATRQEMRAEFEMRLAVLEARLETALSLLGSDPTRAKALRNKRRSNGLLEDHRNTS
jgi:hypothetical protein